LNVFANIEGFFMSTPWSNFGSFFTGPQANSAAPNGSSIAGYRGVDLSGFTPGGSAPALENVPALNVAGTDVPVGDPNFMQSMLGYTNKDTGVHQQGWGGMAISGLSALGNAYMGMKQYGLAKEQFAESKRQYNQNYAAQRTLTNSQLEDRQRARVASNAGAYESVGSYMNRNGVK